MKFVIICHICHYSVNLRFFPIFTALLQIEVSIHSDWSTPSESSLVYGITQNKNNTLSVLKSKHKNMHKYNLFRSKEKLLSVDPGESVSSHFGTVEYFIANTIFCRIGALMRNNWRQRQHTMKSFLHKTPEWL